MTTPKLTQQQIETLRQSCRKALTLSYSPYSNFAVGAAVLLTSGRTVLGANVENATYGATVCAERVAIMKCVTSLDSCVRDVRNWVALGVMASAVGSVVAPCGICRQVIAEFVKSGDTEFVVVMFGNDSDNDDSRFEVRSVGELLPMRFELENGRGKSEKVKGK